MQVKFACNALRTDDLTLPYPPGNGESLRDRRRAVRANPTTAPAHSLPLRALRLDIPWNWCSYAAVTIQLRSSSQIPRYPATRLFRVDSRTHRGATLLDRSSASRRSPVPTSSERTLRSPRLRENTPGRGPRGSAASSPRRPRGAPGRPPRSRCGSWGGELARGSFGRWSCAQRSISQSERSGRPSLSGRSRLWACRAPATRA